MGLAAAWLRGVRQRRRHLRFVGPHREARLPAIREALRVAVPGAVLLVGNSHAEMLGYPDFAGRPCLNAGIGGITADGYADVLAHLADDPARAAVAILFVGTNDLLRYRRPLRPEAEVRFATDVDRILRRLGRWADRVVVAAVPPIGLRNTGHDPDAVAVYSTVLERRCAVHAHIYVDPFAAMREAALPGRARCGLHADGVHLADYGLFGRQVAALVAAHANGVAGPPA